MAWVLLSTQMGFSDKSTTTPATRDAELLHAPASDSEPWKAELEKLQNRKPGVQSEPSLALDGLGLTVVQSSMSSSGKHNSPDHF